MASASARVLLPTPAKAAAIGLGAGAAAAALALNEAVVEKRARRLERLRCFSDHGAARIAAASFSLSDFDQPMVITGLIDSWPARRSWSFPALRSRIAHVLVDCGSIGSEGVPFYAVAHNALRDAPGRHDLGLCVFDSDFSEAGGKASLLSDWSPLPQLTTGDLFASGAAADHPDRPDYRWFLAGPPGSGTPLHQDPWGYSSWNAALVGTKRWVLFPPEVSREVLMPPRPGLLGGLMTAMGMRGYCSAAEFMDEVLPSLRAAKLGHVEMLQRPGEVVVFPANWWHAVVNLDATLAVTESFAEPRNVNDIVGKLRAGKLGVFANVVTREAT